MIEGGSLTVSDIFFNMRRRYQFTGFKLLLLNLLFWGSYKPLSALNNDNGSLESIKTQTLSIVIIILILHQAKLDDCIAMLKEVRDNISHLSDSNVDSENLCQNVILNLIF